MLEDEVKELEGLRRENGRNATINNNVQRFLAERNYRDSNRLEYDLNVNGIRGILENYTSFLLDKGMQIKEEEISRDYEEYLNKPVSDFELSFRTINCFERANIKTVKDLIGKTEKEMWKIESLGRKSFEEIKKAILEPMGLEYRRD